MPLLEGPAREETPIPENQSNIFAAAFPTLFQEGIGDIHAPRLRSLDEYGADALLVWLRFCLYWHDNRFAKHVRFFYCGFNQWLRRKVAASKSFFIKNRKPTPTDFLPENKKKTSARCEHILQNCQPLQVSS